MTHAEEIENIIKVLGRGDLTEGKVRGTHLGKVLIYLQMKKEENYQNTLHKLALVLGMNIRYVRENYLRGLELFGIIKTRMVGNELMWKWMGDKELDSCLFNNGSEETEQSATEYMQEQEKKKPRLKNKCKNCGKPIPEALIFCSEKCVSEEKTRKEKNKK